MFANTYQSGYFLQVWDSRVNADKNQTYKHLFKKVPSSLKNFYDKQVKSYIYQLQGNQKLIFPSDQRQQLSLHQRYIVLQIYVPIGSNWSIEISMNDSNAIKKRVNITTQQGKPELKYFSFRYPLEPNTIQKGIWSFFAIDVYSFINVFKNSVFRSLDGLMVCGNCKIRRIFTMKDWIEFQIPKAYWLAANIPQTMQLVQYKQGKQQIYNNNVFSSPVNYLKMIESKVIQNQPSVLRNSEKPSLLNQKAQRPSLQGLRSQQPVKLPNVPNFSNTKLDRSALLKSSKLSQILSQKGQIGGNMIGISNRSLTKADLIIEKSKVRLNSLQQKQQQILNRLKSQDNQKEKSRWLKNQHNIFKSDLFNPKFSESSDYRDSRSLRLAGSNSPNKLLIKVKKIFQEDNVFKEQSYSSSYSGMGRHQNKKQVKRVKANTQQSKLKGNFSSANGLNQSREKEHNVLVKSLGRILAQSKVSDIAMNPITRQRQDIIEEDVWTDQQEDCQRKPETPIEQMIQSHQIIDSYRQPRTKLPLKGRQTQPQQDQTIITKQNDKQIIIKQSSTHPQNGQLELIYDQMIGCYYHPQTNTYYEIKN